MNQSNIFKSGKYTLTLIDEKIENSDEDFSKISFAYALSATVDKEFRGAVNTFGAHEKLMESISEFEFVIQKPIYEGVVSIWIEIPGSQEDLENLAHILEKYSTKYAFPDGTGTFNESNLRSGKGLLNISQLDSALS